MKTKANTPSRANSADLETVARLEKVQTFAPRFTPDFQKRARVNGKSVPACARCAARMG